MLSREQFTQNLVFLLSQGQLVWPDSPNEPVFGRVGVTPAPPSFFLADAVEPFALIRPAPAKPHPEHEDILETPVWTLGIFSVNANDQSGGAGVVGGQRQGLGSSQGRGILEVESVFIDALKANGIGVSRPRAVEVPEPDFAEVAGCTCIATYKIGATRIPLEPCFSRIQRFKSPFIGAGKVRATWAPAPTRYDLMGYAWSRAAGGTPPATPAGSNFVAGDGKVDGTFSILGTALGGYVFEILTDHGAFDIGGIVGATPVLAAANLAAAINATAVLNGDVLATATGPNVAIAPLATTSIATYVTAGGTPGQASYASGSGLIDVPPSGTWSYSFWWAFDFTADPFTGGKAPTPNRYSGFVQQLVGAPSTFIYRAATLTVTV